MKHCLIHLFVFSLSSGHKSQQSYHPVQEVPQRCQIPQHPLRVCQGGCCDRVPLHTHHLRAFLVALMDSDKDSDVRKEVSLWENLAFEQILLRLINSRCLKVRLMLRVNVLCFIQLGVECHSLNWAIGLWWDFSVCLCVCKGMLHGEIMQLLTGILREGDDK